MRKNSITRNLCASTPGVQPGSGNEKILDGVRYGVNRQAVEVLKRGVHWDSTKRMVNADSPFPLPMRPLPKSISASESVLGRRQGRLTVIGLSIKPKKWVCKCDCGVYVHRTSKAIKNKENYLDRCEMCRQKLFLQKVAYLKMTGKHIQVWDLPGAQ